MNRDELIRMFVLNEISDDYENVDRITKAVTKLAAQCGLTANPSEVLRAWSDLIEGGLARAYRLSPSHQVEEIQGVPPQGEINQAHCYFWITQNGKAVQSDEEHWPFDEKGLVWEGWFPPKG